MYALVLCVFGYICMCVCVCVHVQYIHVSIQCNICPFSIMKTSMCGWMDVCVCVGVCVYCVHVRYIQYSVIFYPFSIMKIKIASFQQNYILYIDCCIIVRNGRRVLASTV